jgi:hypothetical protein
MGHQKLEDLVGLLCAIALVVSLVGFAWVLFSPLLAAYVAGLGTGVVGVLALMHSLAARR